MSYPTPQDPFKTDGAARAFTPAPKRRPRLWLVALLAVLLFGGLIAVGVLIPKALKDVGTAGAATPPPASFVPSRVSLGERGTCILLVPTAKDGTEAISAIVKKSDGSTVDWPKLRTTIKDLKTTKQTAPPDMIADIDGQLGALEHLLALGEGHGKGRLELEEYRSSGLRIAERCGKYAS